MDKWRQKWYDNGLCLGCGKVPDRIGTFCTKCNEKHREQSLRTINRRRERGGCIACGKPLDNQGIRCLECAEKHRDVVARSKDKKKASGLCVRCGKVSNGGYYCMVCRDKNNAKKRERRRLKREIGHEQN